MVTEKDLAYIEQQPDLKDVPAIVLCGGMGTRLVDVTGGKLPKALVPVTRSRQLVEAPLSQLQKWGISKVTYAASDPVIDKIRDFNRLHRDRLPNAAYAVEGDPQGVIQALLFAIEQSKVRGDFVLTHADEFVPDVDLRAMYKQHMNTHAGFTSAGTNHSEAGNNYTGVVDDQNKVVSIKRNEQPDPLVTAYTMTGLFIMNSEKVAAIAKRSTNWDQMMRNALNRDLLYLYPSSSEFLNANTPQELQKLRTIFEKGNFRL